MSDKYTYRESGGGIVRECPPIRGITFRDAKEVIAAIDEKDAKIAALEVENVEIRKSNGITTTKLLIEENKRLQTQLTDHIRADEAKVAALQNKLSSIKVLAEIEYNDADELRADIARIYLDEKPQGPSEGDGGGCDLAIVDACNDLITILPTLGKR